MHFYDFYAVLRCLFDGSCCDLVLAVAPQSNRRVTVLMPQKSKAEHFPSERQFQQNSKLIRIHKWCNPAKGRPSEPPPASKLAGSRCEVHAGLSRRTSTVNGVLESTFKKYKTWKTRLQIPELMMSDVVKNIVSCLCEQRRALL